MSVETWLAFTAIASIATLVPGPAMFLVASHSLKYGVIRSIKTILGNVTGLAILSGLSVIGLSALLIYAPVMFTLVKIVGAIYLAYLGIKLWCNGVQPIDVDKARAKGGSEYLYLKGVFIALLNPKAIIFTTSLFPQFIDHTNSVMPQFFVFLSTFIGLSFACLLGSSIFVRFALGSVAVKYSRFIGRLLGGTLIGASGALLFSSSR